MMINEMKLNDIHHTETNVNTGYNVTIFYFDICLLAAVYSSSLAVFGYL